MFKVFIAAALGLTVLLGGQRAFAEDFYAPFRDCMANCEAGFAICSEHVHRKDPELDAKKEECTSARASCVQECQYLSMPPEEVVPPPVESPPPVENP